MGNYNMYFKEKAETGAKQVNSKNIIDQMVDGIAGISSENPTEAAKDRRYRLSGRAWEFMMFMDDDDETDI